MDSIKTEIVVVGSGPGGYAAAFYAADLGKKVILVERDKSLGGVCLNRGCIPSKALLYATHQIVNARESAHRGIEFAEPKVELDKLRQWKNSVVTKLTGGVATLAKMRGVQVIQGRGYFEGSQKLRVETEQGQQFVEYDKAILAVGSLPAMPRAFDLGNPRVMTSTEALEVPDVPESLLIVGGGYIGMELGFVYAALGSKVVVVEALDAILTGADPDLVRLVAANAKKMFKEIRLKAKVTKMATAGKQIKVAMEYNGQKLEELFDRVLVAVGRVPNKADQGLENTKIQFDERGFVKTNEQRQTDDPNIYAIGDIAGGILLAHKAHKEARIAVEAICGSKVVFDSVIPAVVFTDPELAWCGLTEAEAKEKGIQYQVAKFPWSASGRAISFDRTDGVTKIIVDANTDRVLGVGICGAGAGELIAEAVLAIEMGATAEDIAETVHPHPTLSETLMGAADAYYGHATDIFVKKKEEQPKA
ncbi:MAG TPA: dihydrolipoyl dehydrogenase [Candidatus Acidoferrales bacterium]|jgi:dihydrolipoamide dehydrogenase|nr:dihydrolipoyl dehydrogenase [Candidatus Acidoferrales bacterium]